MSTNCAEPGKGGRLSWYSFSKDLGEMKQVFFVRELEKRVGVEWELTAGGSDLQGSGAFPESGERMLSGLSGR